MQPPGTKQRPNNYWMMNKRIVTLPFVLTATGFAAVLYGAFVLLIEPGGRGVGLFRTFGQNALAAYLLHQVVETQVHSIIPKDSPLGLVLAGPRAAGGIETALAVIFGAAGFAVIGLFLASVSPAGRLIFARDGRVEEAISAATLRWTLGEPQRAVFFRARLASLPAYLPALALGGVTFAAARPSFPGQLAAILLGLWLMLSALVYAHLVVVQLYVGAEKEIERRALGM